MKERQFMSSFAFVHPVIGFTGPSFDIGVVVNRVYDFWEKKIENETIVNGHQLRDVHKDPIINQEFGKLFKESIVPAVNAYVTSISLEKEKRTCSINASQVWINVAEPGSFHHLHVHGHSHLTGIFYLAAEDGSGNLMLQNPYLTGIESLFHTNNIVCPLIPSPGQGYLFASNLPHRVDVNNSGYNQISLCFSIELNNVYTMTS